jgi:dihydroorotate dehydrogenase
MRLAEQDHDLMNGYQAIWPILRLLPPELAHGLALSALKWPIPGFGEAVVDPFEWRGVRFRNRVGIAAGFDKNGVALAGIESLGAGFVEVGTILVEPWRGNEIRPRVKRLLPVTGIWNRLGFPSHGLDSVARNLRAFAGRKHQGLVLGCNIGPHPGHVRAAASLAEYLAIARDELVHLARSLFDVAGFFVVNLSSPNTPGLRQLLEGEDLKDGLLQPVRDAIQCLELEAHRSHPTPLLLKLPPEDASRAPWTAQALESLVRPLIDDDVCDGFVAVNTSTSLAQELGEESGGVSGAPLRPLALRTVNILRQIAGERALILGSGGIMAPKDSIAFAEAGSDLVEIYSGMVYRGPGLIRSCARALADRSVASRTTTG